MAENARLIGIPEGQAFRRKADRVAPCSAKIEGHVWTKIWYDDQLIVAVVCAACGRYPLEILAGYPIMRQ